MARIEAERDNILAGLRFLCDDGQAETALDVACNLSTYWTFTGRHADSSNWLAIALGVRGPVDPMTRLVGEALHAVNLVASTMSSGPAEVEAALEKLREIGRRLDTIVLPSDSILLLLAPAVAMFTDADRSVIEGHIARGLTSNDPWIAATTRLFHAGLAENDGDVATARTEVRAALVQFRELGERWGLASSLGVLAQLKSMDGDIAGAMRDLEEALELTEQLAGHDDTIMLHLRLSYLRIAGEDFAGARECVELMEQQIELSNSRQLAVFAVIARGEIARAEGDTTAATAIADQALELAAAVPPAHPSQGHVAALVYSFAGRISLDRDDVPAARERITSAYGYAIGTRDMPITAGVGVRVAELAAAQLQFRDAAEILGAAARVRGSEDVINTDVVKLKALVRKGLGDTEFDVAYENGRRLDSRAACARLDPDSLAST
jgi:hypothetical protein